MTVPIGFRRNSGIPCVLALHYADLAEADVATSQGYKFTHPLRTILDLIDAGGVERSILRQAIRQAADRGLISRRQIHDTHMTEPARRLIEDALRRAA